MLSFRHSFLEVRQTKAPLQMSIFLDLLSFYWWIFSFKINSTRFFIVYTLRNEEKHKIPFYGAIFCGTKMRRNKRKTKMPFQMILFHACMFPVSCLHTNTHIHTQSRPHSKSVKRIINAKKPAAKISLQNACDVEWLLWEPIANANKKELCYGIKLDDRACL